MAGGAFGVHSAGFSRSLFPSEGPPKGGTTNAKVRHVALLPLGRKLRRPIILLGRKLGRRGSPRPDVRQYSKCPFLTLVLRLVP